MGVPGLGNVAWAFLGGEKHTLVVPNIANAGIFFPMFNRRYIDGQSGSIFSGSYVRQDPGSVSPQTLRVEIRLSELRV